MGEIFGFKCLSQLTSNLKTKILTLIYSKTKNVFVEEYSKYIALNV